ncbi:MAG: hypothetical protein PVF35_01315 [Gammaproteobacteria bacterium]
MVNLVTETFFLPPEVERQAWSVPAEIYNLYRSLLSKSVTGNVFVPVRSMQFLAVMEQDEIVFVDSQSYAVSGNEGGRLILIAWKFSGTHDRGALTDPVPCDVVYYGRKGKDTQLRLVRDFRDALEQLDQRYRDGQMPQEGAKILQLHKT